MCHRFCTIAIAASLILSTTASFGDRPEGAAAVVQAPAVAPATNAKPVTLMGMLSPWLYPDAKFGGAESSDAAVSDISSIKSKAVLTTPDAADDVLKFYLKKLNVDKEGKNLDEKDGERITTERAIAVQDLSSSRPMKLFVITVNRKGSSTTVVISRGEQEEKTQISWSNYRQLWP